MSSELSIDDKSSEETESQQELPSFLNTKNYESIARTRIWSEDITKYWNVRIKESETLKERLELSHEQMKCIFNKLSEEMNICLNAHSPNTKAKRDMRQFSLKMLDTFIQEKHIPNGRETGTAIVLDIGSECYSEAQCAKVQVGGRGKITINKVSADLSNATPGHPKGLLDKNASATSLFDTLASLVRRLEEDNVNNSLFSNGPCPVILTAAFPLNHKSLCNAQLIHWSKHYETGYKTNDPVEGLDIGKLLNCAFKRLNLPAFTKAIINDTTATLLACSYNKHPLLPPCRVAYIVGSGCNGCYIQPDARRLYNYTGSVIDCGLESFNKSLPVNDVDLEVDFADQDSKGFNSFEKMVTTFYINEICRRLIVKVWQNKAPQLAWVRYSLPWTACVNILEQPETEELEKTNDILRTLWDWNTTLEDRIAVKKLFNVVFERSAALSAIAIVALSHQTERLQPAMGGLTCAISGDLITQSNTYKKNIQIYLEKVLLNNTAKQIHLFEVTNGAIKGGAFLNTLI